MDFDIMEILLHLFNVSISASFLALAVVLFRLIFKKAPRWLIVALWALVAIRLLCPFSLESALSLIPSGDTIPSEIMTLDPDKVPDASFGLIENPAYSEYFNSTVVVDNVDRFQLKFMFASFGWLIGVGLLLFYALVSYLRLRWTVRASVPLKDNVRICDNVKTPFILGVFRPKIYLPSDMDEETAELVLLHERAHLKRKDHLWKPFGFVLLSVYWFNPVLWLSYILLCRDIELACDEKVIRDMEGSDKRAYSEALLSCSVPQKMISACPVAFGEVGVKKRIKNVLNYKKPAFWLIFTAVVVSVILAVCFMTDPKSENGDEYIKGVDEISELSFNMKDIVFGAHSYTIYEGTDTTDNYFDAKIEDAFSHSEVSSFLDHLVLEQLPDGTVNTMHEPQTSAVIKINYDDYWSVNIIFHDDFSKMYMQKSSPDYFIRSKDYSVIVEQAREFFEEKPYLSHALVWEFNPASSALGHGEINVFVDEKFEISGEVTGDGTITRISDEEKGEGISWRPDIVENPGVYNIEIPVTGDGEKTVFSFTMTMVGKRGASSYYTLRADDLVIASYPDDYSFELSVLENEEHDSTPVYLDAFDSDEFNSELFIKLMMTDLAVIRNGDKEAVVYGGGKTESALSEWRFEKGYYSHPSQEDLANMREYSIEVDDDMGKTYSINFDKGCNIMWLEGRGWSDFPHKVINPKQIRSFFENQEFFDDSFVWEYDSSADTYADEALQLVVEGEYKSYTAECSEGTLMTATVSDDRTGGIVYSEPLKKITCTKEDNLVWRPTDNGTGSTEIIHVEQKLANGETKDFYVDIFDWGTNYSGNRVYGISAEYAQLMMKNSGVCYLEQTYDVNWLYNPMLSATWHYVTQYSLSEDYEIISAEATSGEASVKELYYNDLENGKCVRWSPDADVQEDAVLTIIARKDNKEIEFVIDIDLLGANQEAGRRTYRLSPVNCKLTEEYTSVYFLEER